MRQISSAPGLPFRPPWRAIVSAVAVGAAATAATGCGSSGSSGASAGSPTTGGGARSGALRVVSNAIPGTLDPGQVVQNQDCVLRPMYITLTKLGTKPGPDGTTVTDAAKIEPYLASSWEVSKDLRTYRFKLKRGLKFASGTPVDAHAVKFSFERALKFPTGEVFMTDNIPDNIKSYAAPSDDVFVVHLRQPDPDLLESYGRCPSSIVDPSVVRKHDKNYLTTHEAGSGPFRMVSYKPGQSLELEARPAFTKWAGQAPNSSAIDVSFVADNSALLLKTRSGQADVTIGLPKQSAAGLKSSMRVVASPTYLREQLLLNWATAPFDNAKVREAALRAIPYDSIVKNVAKGYAHGFYGPIIPNLKYFNAALSKPIPTDVEAAKAAMRASGVKTPINVKVAIIQGNAIDQQLATILQAAWKPLGINVTVQQYPTTQFSSYIYSDKMQSAIRNGGPSVASAAYYLGYSMRCKVPGTGVNPNHTCIPEADKLLDQARSSADAAANQKLYDQITQIWRSKWPEGFFYNDVAVAVLGKDVAHYRYEDRKSVV